MSGMLEWLIIEKSQSVSASKNQDEKPPKRPKK
jgi:hypothetical protein